MAAPAKLAFAPPKPSAPAASSQLSTALARRPRPRTRLLVRDALAVSLVLLSKQTLLRGARYPFCNSSAPAIAFSVEDLEYDDADMIEY